MAGMAARPFLWLSIAAVSTLPIVKGISMAASYHPSALIALLGLKQPGGYWRVIAIIFALLNLKSLPFAWHYRLLRALLKHVSLPRSRCPPAPPLPALFTPCITSTRCSLLEMDYNLHKSNSTYFSDLDISRMHLVTSLFKRGLHKLHFKTIPDLLPDAKPGRFGIYFGGVQCSFKREIKPGQKVEIWSRVLAWDQKWLYLVSHFVEAGAEQPSGYWLQPWKKSGKAKTRGQSTHPSTAVADAGTAANGNVAEGKLPHRAVMATSVSKYVFKQGRITIPPELALQGAELLPPKPEGFSAEPSLTTTSEDDSEPLGPPLEATLENWDWAAVERERQRGMKLARHMRALDDAALVWSGSEGMALGAF